jgi:hypothetical protein
VDKMKKIIVVLYAASFLVSCATPYKANGIMGGYSDIQLSENVFKVSFRGNGYTNPERAADFCLLRSAEVALANGYNYFVIVESGQSSKVGAYTTPTTTKTDANARISGNTIYGNATTTTYGGQTYIISKPSSMNTILCFKEKPDIQGLVFSAEIISRSIKNKYNIK